MKDLLTRAKAIANELDDFNASLDRKAAKVIREMCIEVERYQSRGNQYLELRAELETEKQNAARLAGLLEEYISITGEPPEANCSCHLSPPCNDCVDNAGWREVFQSCQFAIAAQGTKT